jgi:hypothetical protein
MNDPALVSALLPVLDEAIRNAGAIEEIINATASR